MGKLFPEEANISSVFWHYHAQITFIFLVFAYFCWFLLDFVERRSLMSNEAMEAVLAVLRGGATMKEAAAAGGVSRSTLWRWINADAAFFQDVADALLEGERAAVEWLLAAWAKHDSGPGSVLIWPRPRP